MVQPWPHVQKEMISKEADAAMALLIDTISAVRNIRAVWKIELQKDIAAHINVHSASSEKILNENAGIIRRLAKVSGLNIGKLSKPRNAAASVVGDIEIYVPLEGLIDLEKEKARLGKESSALEEQIRAITARLKDKNFASKAPKDVVGKQKARLEELKLSLAKLKSNLEGL
jgi:valyl-tRNA synthetase